MGLLAALPYLGNAIIVQFGGHLADHLRTRFKISTTIVIIDITLFKPRFKQHIRLLLFCLEGAESIYQWQLHHPDEFPPRNGPNDPLARFGPHLFGDCC